MATPEQRIILDSIKSKYKPKEEYEIHFFAGQSGRCSASIYKKGIINTRFGKEEYSGSLANFGSMNKDELEKFLQPYVDLREVTV